MKKSKRLWIIIGILLTVTGILIFAGGLAVLNFDFTKLNTEKYETNTYEVDEKFDKILIDVTTADIVFVPSDDEKCKVVCYEKEKVNHSATVQNKTLVVETIDNQKWYDHIDLVSFGSMKITIYLPQAEYKSLSVETDTGDVEIPKDFSFENIEVDGDTASIACFASASEMIKISTDTGDIKADTVSAGGIKLNSSTGKIDLTSADIEDAVEIKTDTGDVQLENIKCRSINAVCDLGDVTLINTVAKETLNIEVSTGDVLFDKSDAASIYVITNIGDITGTLLSEKVFITEAPMGNISLPKTTTGGKCELITDTGDIEISIY